MLRSLSTLIGCSLLWATAAQAAAADIVVRSDGADIHSGPWFMRVTALADDILRVRAAAGDLPEDASWAVPEEMRGRSVHVSVKQHADGVDFQTATVAVRFERSPLRLIVSDLAGHVISADAPTGAVNVVGSGFTLRKKLNEKEHIFGLGDKTGPLDRRGQAFTLWNTDAYRFQESTDPIYKSIPFFVAAGGPGGSYGILLDNTWRTWFDFGKQDPQTLAVGAAAGPID
jgi:alpha-glucosidase